ncbi:MAG: RpiB/LacA/LacB family sugar-phosphate isomerase [bacterium]
MKEKTAKKIVLATDHAGFAMKEVIKTFLQGKGYTIDDLGAHTLVADDDYPRYMAKAGLKIAEDTTGELKAIIFGHSGQGEAMVANRFPGVRAAVYYGGPVGGVDGIGMKGSMTEKSQEVLRLSREHNDANVLSIGAYFVTETEAKEAVTLWLATAFSGDERHVRRIQEMDSIQ